MCLFVRFKTKKRPVARNGRPSFYFFSYQHGFVTHDFIILRNATTMYKILLCSYEFSTIRLQIYTNSFNQQIFSSKNDIKNKDSHNNLCILYVKEIKNYKINSLWSILHLKN